MTDAGLGRWAPLALDEVVRLFTGAPMRWFITGGHALELHLGRSWRDHDDIDVGIVRHEAPALRGVLAGWDLHVAAAGVLHPWTGRSLSTDPDDHENNLWCRPAPDAPWAIDVTVGEGDATDWIYRRDPSIRRPWPEAVLVSPTGIPYLAPDLQLLYKSVRPRPKDLVDADEFARAEPSDPA